MTAIDYIVQHAPKGQWRNTATGAVHTVVWAAPREVVSVSDVEAWLGTAAQFVREFEVLP